MKKFLSFVLTVVLLSGLFLIIPNANLTVSSFEDIPEDAIRIKTAAELMKIGGGQSANKYYVLEYDIFLKTEWIPIEDFQGTFDGRGHTINNLYVKEKSDRQYAGLFGSTNGATIENIGINITSSGVKANSNPSYSGGLIGLSSNSTVKNCYITGDVSTDSKGESYAGGLIGKADGCTISNCYTTGNITASGSRDSSYAGGLIGLNNESTIENCYRLSTQKIKGEKIDESGEPLSSAQMNSKRSFIEWDFEGIWTHKAGVNNDYPVFISANRYREAHSFDELKEIITEMANEVTGYTVLVLDLSKSMREKPAQALKDSAITFCKINLGIEGNQVAIVTFSKEVINSSLFQSSSVSLINWIDDNIPPPPKTSNRTNFSAAVDKANDLLANIQDNIEKITQEDAENAENSNISEGAEKNIFIISDGQPNTVSTDKISELVKREGKRELYGFITYPYLKNDYQHYRCANHVYEKVYNFKKNENCYVWALALFYKLSKKEKEDPNSFSRRFLQDLVEDINNPDSVENQYAETWW